MSAIETVTISAEESGGRLDRVMAARIPSLSRSHLKTRFVSGLVSGERGVKRFASAAREEFESVKLNREKVISGGGEIVVFLGPLSSGTYDFFGEFHRETATGEIVVK